MTLCAEDIPKHPHRYQVLVAATIFVLQACSEGGTTTLPCPTFCGSHSTCRGGACVCEPNFSDCNQNKATDGCECPGTTCNGTACGSSSGVCSPKTTNSCNNANQYCTASNTCLPCQNSWNCNGIDDCECGPTGCTGSVCSAQQNCTHTLDRSCATDMKYCATNNTCIACVGNARDCNGKGSDLCECPNGCDGAGGCGTTVSCVATTAHSCGVNTKYCASNDQCVDCSPSTRRDCNGLSNDGCECENGCNGEQCAPAGGTCDPTQKNACSSNKKVCSPTTKTCQDCGTAFECDGFSSTFCECPSGGCDGEDCVGSCSSCSADVNQWCPSGTCTACPTGRYDCDLDNTKCECPLGCDSTSCKSTPCGSFGTCKATEVCIIYGDASDYICIAAAADCDADRSCSCLTNATCQQVDPYFACTDAPEDNTIFCN